MSLTKSFIKYTMKNLIFNTIQSKLPYIVNIASPTQIAVMIALSKLGFSAKVIGIIILFI
jgi:hypothetical protein